MIEKKIANMPKFPSMVVASVTNTCTHQCLHCQHKEYSKRSHYKRMDMDISLFRKIVDEMSNYPKTVLRIVAWGEPCLHPKIIEFINYATSKVNTIIITNGYLLCSELSLALMKTGLQLVEISIDAANIETYRTIRHCDDQNAYNVVVNNVIEMIKLRNLHKYKTKIVVSYVTWPNDASEKEYLDFEKNWQGIADGIVKRRLHSFCGTISSNLVKLPEDRLPCYGLWGRCNINPVGEIAVCYNQWIEHANILADLNDPEITIYNTWNGPVLEKIRQEQMKGIFTGPCHACIDYNPFAWKHPFEEVIRKTVRK